MSMSETAWLSCKNPPQMWRHIISKLSQHCHNRKKLLFHCATARLIMPYLLYESSLEATPAVIDENNKVICLTEYFAEYPDTTLTPLEEIILAQINNPTLANIMFINDIRFLDNCILRMTATERQQLPVLLCCIFNNSLLNLVPIINNDEWLAWNGGVIKNMAQTIYDDRAFDRMPILADALEDAGCNNTDILNHCRGSNPHTRGCWVIDLLLQK